MQHLIFWIEKYGLWFVFLNVLIEQAGMPLPAFPTLVVTGALVGRGEQPAWALISTAVVASVIADLAWYAAGRRFGRRVLMMMCRLSLSPDNCVRQTESTYARLGSRSLLVAKFIPGFAAVATALAGELGTPAATFVVFDSIGAAIWASAAVFSGVLFHGAVDRLLDSLASLGHVGLVVIALAFLSFIAWKSWQRRRFYRELRMARITVEELRALVDDGHAPTIFDVRSPFAQEGGHIPGAISIDDKDLDASASAIGGATEVVVYCACPNEASAARIAKALMGRGVARVRPLAGGIEAWVAAGNAIER